ncbi:hypothetical protein BH10PSE18_BH10PSE18_14200 [soil metagenome]
MIRAMKTVLSWRLDPAALAWALALFVALVLLATVGARTGWLRNFFGDVLAVIWLHAVFRSVLAVRPTYLALAAFGTGCALEFGQYLAALWHWQLPNRALRILLGSTPDWNDVLAYGLGLAAILLLEAWRARRIETGKRT